MNFIIRGEFAEIKSGPPGRQLECYIPAGVVWRQLNYGQGEGQVEIGGCEWEFYWVDHPAELHVVLHAGEMDAEESIAFVHRVGAKVIQAI